MRRPASRTAVTVMTLLVAPALSMVALVGSAKPAGAVCVQSAPAARGSAQAVPAYCVNPNPGPISFPNPGDYSPQTGTTSARSAGTFWFTCSGAPFGFPYNATGAADWNLSGGTLTVTTDYMFNLVQNGRNPSYPCSAAATDNNQYNGNPANYTEYGNAFWNTCCWTQNDSVVTAQDPNINHIFNAVTATTNPGAVMTTYGCCQSQLASFRFLSWPTAAGNWAPPSN